MRGHGVRIALLRCDKAEMTLCISARKALLRFMRAGIQYRHVDPLALELPCMITDPFKLMGRFLVASFQITGYVLTFITQICWYFMHGQSDKIGDALGFLGRSITDALGDALRK